MKYKTVDLKCLECGKVTKNYLLENGEIVPCCDEAMVEIPSGPRYRIGKGDNSASTTPKPFRGEK